VSVGAAQAQKEQNENGCDENKHGESGRDETLAQLLDRARSAMECSMREGGNKITLAPGVKTCLPS
jgi:hypothetical protein